MYQKLIRTNVKRSITFVTSLFFLVMAGQVFADVAVVANNGISVDSITAGEAKKIWLGKSKSLGGTKLKTADLPVGNVSRDHFYSTVVKKSGKKLKAYWAKIVFSGKGTPPKLLESDADVIAWVAKTPGGLGYVNSDATSDSVKVLLVVK